MNDEIKNLFLAICLSIIVLLGWQYYSGPQNIENVEQQVMAPAILPEESNTNILAENIVEDNSKKITIDTPKLRGSFSLKGLRINDLYLKNYKKTSESDSDNERLFGSDNPNLQYFAEFGWLASDSALNVPNKNTVWHTKDEHLNEQQHVNLTWNNGQGLIFEISVSVDDKYMFKVEQTVHNKTNNQISLRAYSLLFRSSETDTPKVQSFHEGSIGVFDDTLEEISFEDLVKKKNYKYENKKTAWVGFSDKYWLAAIIPQNDKVRTTKFIGENSANIKKYQVDSLTPEMVVPINSSLTTDNYLYAGAKVADYLNDYQKTLNISLFDRAIDYGWFYFLTKPMLSFLNYIYKYVQNFGLAIISLTLIIKILMFPITNKSYKMTRKMKKLQPKVAAIKLQYADDSVRLNTEIMALYKKEKVNPIGGCLPVFLQIPVFFSLYKVIFISLEMRHAPFFGWIKDLSAADPLTIFNLFGLIPWTPPQFLMIGFWPVLMGVTMYFLQKSNPQAVDPIQEKIMGYLPFIFILMFSSFPVGLLIYWSFSNLLSIIQQQVINYIYEKE